MTADPLTSGFDTEIRRIEEAIEGIRIPAEVEMAERASAKARADLRDAEAEFEAARVLRLREQPAASRPSSEMTKLQKKVEALQKVRWSANQERDKTRKGHEERMRVAIGPLIDQLEDLCDRAAVVIENVADVAVKAEARFYQGHGMSLRRFMADSMAIKMTARQVRGYVARR